MYQHATHQLEDLLTTSRQPHAGRPAGYDEDSRGYTTSGHRGPDTYNHSKVHSESQRVDSRSDWC